MPVLRWFSNCFVVWEDIKMYATSLGAEYDLITLQNEFDIEKPTWEQVRNAILALDGSNPNTIIIETKE